MRENLRIAHWPIVFATLKLFRHFCSCRFQCICCFNLIYCGITMTDVMTLPSDPTDRWSPRPRGETKESGISLIAVLASSLTNVSRQLYNDFRTRYEIIQILEPSRIPGQRSGFASCPGDTFTTDELSRDHPAYVACLLSVWIFIQTLYKNCP